MRAIWRKSRRIPGRHRARPPGCGGRAGGYGDAGSGGTAITGRIECRIAPVRLSESELLRDTCRAWASWLDGPRGGLGLMGDGGPWEACRARRGGRGKGAGIRCAGAGSVGGPLGTVAGSTGMKKSDIVEGVAGRMGLSKSMAEGAVDTVLEAITEGLAKEEAVRIAGFGTFATRRRGARTGRNPRTGESVTIAASKAPSFKAGKALRNAVNEGWRAKAPEPAHRQDMLDRAHGETRRGVGRTGRCRHGAVVAVRGRGRMAKRGNAHGIVHGCGRYDSDGALESGVDDVHTAHPRSVAMVRPGGMPRRGRSIQDAVAQDRPVRPLPVVQRPARGPWLGEAPVFRPKQTIPIRWI